MLRVSVPRLQERDVLSVRRESGAGDLRIAEQQLAVDQRGQSLRGEQDRGRHTVIDQMNMTHAQNPSMSPVPSNPARPPQATRCARSTRSPVARRSRSTRCDTGCARRPLEISPTAVRILAGQQILDARMHYGIAIRQAEGPQAIDELPEQLRIARRHRYVEVLAQEVVFVRQPLRRQAIAAVVVQRVHQMRDGQDTSRNSGTSGPVRPHRRQPAQHIEIGRTHRYAAAIARVRQHQGIAPDVVA